MKKAKERLNAKQNLIHLKIKVNTFIYLRLMIILVLLIFCASLKKPGIFIFIILGSIIYFGSEAIFYDYPLFTKRKKEYDEFIEFLSFLKLEPNLKENVIDSIINVLNEVNYSFSDTLRSIAQKRKYGEKEKIDNFFINQDIKNGLELILSNDFLKNPYLIDEVSNKISQNELLRTKKQMASIPIILFIVSLIFTLTISYLFYYISTIL